jgi:hypothetical protein
MGVNFLHNTDSPPSLPLPFFSSLPALCLFIIPKVLEMTVSSNKMSAWPG